MAQPGSPPQQPLIQVRGLSVAAGGRLVQQALDFDVHRGEVFVIMGPSGCGKSTLLRHLVGLEAPAAGSVHLQGFDLHRGPEDERARRRRRLGVMFQAGALWSSMTVGDNLMLPMRMFGGWPEDECRRRARFCLALVGLDGCFELSPAGLSGGMRKRAALARAMALEPDVLVLDEPGSGLDPGNTARLDRLVLNLRHHLGTTIVMVTHEVASILGVADRALYLDDELATMTALGPPHHLLRHGPAPVRRFLDSGRARAHRPDSEASR